MSTLLTVLGLGALIAAMIGISRFVYGHAAGDGRRAWDVRPPRHLLREVVARLLAGLAPALVPLSLLWVAIVVGGVPEPTTAVRVNYGPARDAGMQDADRIVAIDGQAMRSWEDVRAALHLSEPPAKPPVARRILVQRAGHSDLLVRVVPNADGRIGVSAMERSQSIGAGAAAKLALNEPLALLRNAFSGASDKQTMPGPSSLSQQTGNSGAARASQVLQFMALTGCYAFGPLFLVAHAFDAMTLGWFLTVNGRAIQSEDRSLWRVERARQLLWLLLVVDCLSTIALLLGDSARDISAPIRLWIAPLLLPVGWILARALRDRAAAVWTVFGLLVPFYNLFAMWRLSPETDRLLSTRGVHARWLRR